MTKPKTTIDATYSEATIGPKDYSINGCAPINAVELKDKETNKTKQPHRFKPGNQAAKGNKASRTRLSDRFLVDALAAWKDNGVDALNSMATRAPAQFCTMIAGILPKDFQVSVTDDSQGKWVINAQPTMTHDEWCKANNIRTIEHKDNQ